MRWDEQVRGYLDKYRKGEKQKVLAFKEGMSERCMQNYLFIARQLENNPALAKFETKKEAIRAIRTGKFFNKKLILIEEVDHRNQRYDTYGDWEFREKGHKKYLSIRVSRTGDIRYSYLLAIHELIEALLCRLGVEKVNQADVDAWDLEHAAACDPGSIEGCPYKKQHDIALAVEQMLCEKLGMNWYKYEETLGELRWRD